MHRQPGQQSLFCRHGNVDPEQKTDLPPDRLSVEEEANVFAAALTMPAHLIREHYERLKHETTATSGCASYSPRQERRWADDYMQ